MSFKVQSVWIIKLTTDLKPPVQPGLNFDDFDEEVFMISLASGSGEDTNGSLKNALYTAYFIHFS